MIRDLIGYGNNAYANTKAGIEPAFTIPQMEVTVTCAPDHHYDCITPPLCVQPFSLLSPDPPVPVSTQ
jgi:hypothetical protein